MSRHSENEILSYFYPLPHPNLKITCQYGPMAEIGEPENLVPEGFWARFVKNGGILGGKER